MEFKTQVSGIKTELLKHMLDVIREDWSVHYFMQCRLSYKDVPEKEELKNHQQDNNNKIAIIRDELGLRGEI